MPENKHDLASNEKTLIDKNNIDTVIIKTRLQHSFHTTHICAHVQKNKKFGSLLKYFFLVSQYKKFIFSFYM